MSLTKKGLSKNLSRGVWLSWFGWVHQLRVYYAAAADVVKHTVGECPHALARVSHQLRQSIGHGVHSDKRAVATVTHQHQVHAFGWFAGEYVAVHSAPFWRIRLSALSTESV